MLIALASILYGSVMAFTQTNVRLIAGYSSVAQLGFITLGIFSLRADGADGAVLQMVNHGLVVAAVFMVIAIVYARDQDRGPRPRWAAWRCARRCSPPCSWWSRWRTWRCPGSANFIGEFYILNGVFESKIVFAFVAAIGVALAAFYSLRLYQRAMHNRLPEGAESREIGLRDGVVLAPLVALHRRAGALARADPRARRGLGDRDAVAAARCTGRRGDRCSRAMTFEAPHIDYAGHLADHRADRRAAC